MPSAYTRYKRIVNADGKINQKDEQVKKIKAKDEKIKQMKEKVNELRQQESRQSGSNKNKKIFKKQNTTNGFRVILYNQNNEQISREKFDFNERIEYNQRVMQLQQQGYEEKR